MSHPYIRSCLCVHHHALCVFVYTRPRYIRLSDGLFSVQFENPVSFTRGSLIVHSIHFVHTHLFVRCVVSFLLLTCVLFILFALFSIHILYSNRKITNFFSELPIVFSETQKNNYKENISLLFKSHELILQIEYLFETVWRFSSRRLKKKHEKFNSSVHFAVGKRKFIAWNSFVLLHIFFWRSFLFVVKRISKTQDDFNQFQHWIQWCA